MDRGIMEEKIDVRLVLSVRNGVDVYAANKAGDDAQTSMWGWRIKAVYNFSPLFSSSSSSPV